MSTEEFDPGPGASTAIVTGTSTGIGRTTTKLLDREGWRVFAGVRRSEDADALRSECSDRVTPLLLDVTQQAQIDQAVKDVDKALAGAPLTAIVNNAGIGFGGPLEYCDVEATRRGFEVNVFGPIAMIRAFLPLMRRGKDGRIVNISSAAGLAATPLLGPYCASKAALESLSDALRMELRNSGIQVSVVEPGFIDTPMQGKGHQQIDDMRATLDDAGHARYDAVIDKFAAMLKSFGKNAAPAEKVASAVLEALTASRAPARRAVGTDAKVIGGVVRRLPTRLRDALFGRLVGL